MSRFLNASKRMAVADLCTNRLPDSESVLLSEETATDTACAASVEVLNDETVPFVEIPEVQPSADFPETDNGESAPSVRFQLSLPQASQLNEERTDSDWLAAICLQSSSWKEELDAFWQQILRAQVRSLLLINALPSQSAPRIALAVALRCVEHDHPVLIVETTHDCGLHEFLRRAPAPGWTDWLAGLPLACAIQSTAHPEIHYLAVGHRLAYVDHRSLPNDYKALWAELSSKYARVIFVAGMTSPWVFTLGYLADAVGFLLNEAVANTVQDPRVLAIQACAARCLGYLLVSVSDGGTIDTSRCRG